MMSRNDPVQTVSKSPASTAADAAQPATSGRSSAHASADSTDGASVRPAPSLSSSPSVETLVSVPEAPLPPFPPPPPPSDSSTGLSSQSGWVPPFVISSDVALATVTSAISVLLASSPQLFDSPSQSSQPVSLTPVPSSIADDVLAAAYATDPDDDDDDNDDDYMGDSASFPTSPSSHSSSFRQ